MAAAVLALGVYLGRERLGGVGLGMAGLRTAGFAALFVALFNPESVRRLAGGDPTVFLDASLSMDAAGGRWSEARDTARAIAGGGGLLYRFGTRVTAYDTLPPDHGTTELLEVLRAGAGRGGPVYIVTDGEVRDGASLPPSLVHGVTTVVLPRDTVANAALLDVTVPTRAQQSDTIRVGLLVGTWGGLDTAGAVLELWTSERRVWTQPLNLPPPPGTARRTVAIVPGALAPGAHVLRFRLRVPGDVEPGDDERARIVAITTQPALVLLVDPADVEGRFLLNEISAVTQASVKGYARVQDDTWIDMETIARVSESAVRAAARGAGLVVVRGRDALGATVGARAVWTWPAGADPTTEFFDGDWYVTTPPPSSPLAGRFAAVAWDSVPPLVGLVPLVPADGEWVALTGRLGRRGADRPLLIGRDSAGVRRLTTAGAGIWRWGLRGGAAREAYRAAVAGGVDWLLATGTVDRGPPLTAAPVAARGVSVAFRWTGADMPDSVRVEVSGADTAIVVSLRFDARGVALAEFPPGAYTWTAPDVREATGMFVVESYSDEFHPAPVTLTAASSESGFRLWVRRAREMWWLFVVAMAAFVGEWGWRQRRGLP